MTPPLSDTHKHTHTHSSGTSLRVTRVLQREAATLLQDPGAPSPAAAPRQRLLGSRQPRAGGGSGGQEKSRAGSRSTGLLRVQSSPVAEQPHRTNMAATSAPGGREQQVSSHFRSGSSGTSSANRCLLFGDPAVRFQWNESKIAPNQSLESLDRIV